MSTPAHEPDLLLESIRIENIQGFDSCTVPIGRGNSLLVGPNNSGKTSVLRVLDWVFNQADRALLSGTRGLSDLERGLLVPARQTGGKARRITLQIRVRDGRTARRFNGTDHVAWLRLGLRNAGINGQLGVPTRGEGSASAPLAIELLERLQACYSVEYVPPHRSATADGFQSLVRQELLERARSALLQSQAGGRPSTRQSRLQGAVDTAASITADELKSFWNDLEEWMPEGLDASGDFHIPLERSDLLDFLVDRAAERVATGTHDVDGVRVHELGAGHQSLLWLALKLRDSHSGKLRMLLIEEPESFLHPSAQRQVARKLLDAHGRQVIISTHSTVLVDEADAGHLRLVRGHRIFSLDQLEERRMQINTALLTGRGSEVIFSSAILLVEGPGDRLYFERLRRRLAGVVPAHILGAMSVLDVGGKEQFAPWVRLLEGFSNRATGERPISSLVASDSGDAVTSTLRGLNDAGITVPAEIRAAAQRIPQALQDGHLVDASDVATKTIAANELSLDGRFGMHFVPVDLEYSALVAAKKMSAMSLASEFGISAATPEALMAALGSKGAGARPSSDAKAPWMRERIATTLPWSEISIGVKNLLWHWAVLAAAQLKAELVERPPELLEVIRHAPAREASPPSTA